MKLKLESVRNEDKVSKNGKPYVACSIKVNGEYLNGFGNETTKQWKAGDEVEAEVYEEEYNGKTYKKFKVASEKDQMKTTLAILAKDIESLKERISKLEKNEPVQNKPASDLPF